MGNTDRDDDAVAERREFVRRLRTHEGVQRLDFSRDGFRTVVVELHADTDFHDEWHRTATRLGYTVERIEPDESRSSWPGEVWLLEREEVDGSVDEPTWASAIRGAAARLVRTLRDLLAGRP